MEKNRNNELIRKLKNGKKNWKDRKEKNFKKIIENLRKIIRGKQ